eukprot:m.137656 g.137656  ORF g.137656 m.137656 type:complete len:392 (+) comp16607_c0_seq1:38-1213(+)
MEVLIGSYGIALHAAEFDAANGTLRKHRAVTVDTVPSPSFAVLRSDKRVCYAVGESGEGSVHALAVEPGPAVVTHHTGDTATAAFRPIDKLRLLNSVPSGGADPCHITISPDGKVLAVANYTGGTVFLHRLNEQDGSIGERVALLQHTHATHVDAARQEAAHPHAVVWAPRHGDQTSSTVHLLVVPDLGADRVYLYDVDTAAGSVRPHLEQPWFEVTPQGSGPRHIEFSHDAQHAYIINEMGNTVTVVAYDARVGSMHALQTVSTLPASLPADLFSNTAEIAISADGKTVYASNRGHDSIAVFQRDTSTGLLHPHPQSHVSTPSKPRHFALSPDGRWLLCGGQTADAIAVYAVAADGSLARVGEYEAGSDDGAVGTLVTPSPVCILFVQGL